MKHLLTILFLLCLCTLNAAGQGITRQKCAICGKLKVQCPGHEKTCTSCGKVISKCPYKGNHPVEKKCPTCGKPLSKCPGHEAKCRSCGKVISKCPYKGKHPAQKDKGYYVAIGCNVAATVSIDDDDYEEIGEAAVVYFETGGAHQLKFKADGYEDYSTVINISKSSTSFFFDLKEMDAKALYSKGKGYYNKKDYAEAVKWYRKAAEQGNAVAQCDLGYCYSQGLGVIQDKAEALKWYKKAAEQGDATAQYNMGLYCQYGTGGVMKDNTEAVKWYRKAAEQGNTSAQSNLGYCYYDGLGVTQDYTEAVEWFRKAAEQGNVFAQSILGYCYEKGLGVVMNLTEAVKCYRKAAEQGSATAQYNLGLCYEYGKKGVTQDKAEAMKWYRKAAEQGYEDAKKKLQELDNAVITVTGTVLDESNEPLIAASIMLSGTKTGTVTDFDGKFRFNVSPNDILEIRYVGYKSEKIRITNETKNVIVKLRSL